MPEPLEPVLTVDPPGTQESTERRQVLFDFITGPLRRWLTGCYIDPHYLKRLQVVSVGNEYVLVLERFDGVPGVRQVAVDSQGNPSSRIEVYLVDTAPPALPGATK